MKLSVNCNISPGYIGEIESGRKFPTTELIEKIAYALRVEPYLFFKNPKENNVSHSTDDSRLPYSVKSQIRTQIKREIKNQLKAQVKTQINAQVNTQLNLSIQGILNDINGILEKY